MGPPGRDAAGYRELNHELNRLFDSKVDDCNVVAASALVTPATKERSVGVHARSRSST
jgi:hypothetical protein